MLCWGANGAKLKPEWYDNSRFSILCDGSLEDKLFPTPVQGLGSDFTVVTSTIQHTCALSASGRVVCWGINTGGELGDAVLSESRGPTQVSGIVSGAVSVSAGGDSFDSHTCAVLSDGGVKCWGSNTQGQIGSGQNGGQAVIPAIVHGSSASR